MGFDAHAAAGQVMRLRMRSSSAVVGQCRTALRAVGQADLEEEAVKKKARPRGNAPSNKTFGNCLLGFHCSQRTRPDNAHFLVFLALPDTNSESYTHFIHSAGIVAMPLVDTRGTCRIRAGNGVAKGFLHQPKGVQKTCHLSFIIRKDIYGE
jgi:hypothetical protein